MKLVIAGSRHLDEDLVYAEIVKLRITDHPISQATEIVWGGAKGSDQAGKDYGDFYGIPVKPFLPDTKMYTYGRACNIRNNKMAVYGDALLLIWDGFSTGSRNMKKAMIDLGKPVYEIIMKKDR